MAGYRLSPDRRTLIVTRRTPDGTHKVTLKRDAEAGPFTADDIAAALASAAGTHMQPGQRNITRRTITRYGTVWRHVMLGPPTWWLPKIRREKDGTLMAGWLRLAVAVRFEKGK